MKNLLIYYGWLNSYNSAQNSWTNEKVAQDLARYDLLVIGNDLQDPQHGDYSNTRVIIPRVQALNPNALVFGYVSVNQSLANFQAKVDGWVALGVNGIFMDEAGYDYGTTDTNSRIAFNTKVDYVHSQGLACFANAWNYDHVMTVANDTSYPNSTWNPGLIQTNLTACDWYLLESFAISNDGTYESGSQWKARGDKIDTEKIQVAAVSVIPDNDGDAQNKFNFIYRSAIMWGLDAVGSSDTSYGSSSAKTTMLSREEVPPLFSFNVAVVQDAGDSDVYHRYIPGYHLSLDFSTGAQSSTKVKY